MHEHCEVCENFRPEANRRTERKMSKLSFGRRRVVLCVAHARIAENTGVSSLEELRDLYRESEGKRSFVPRRAGGVRSPVGKPARSPGRRATDSRV